MLVQQIEVGKVLRPSLPINPLARTLKHLQRPPAVRQCDWELKEGRTNHTEVIGETLKTQKHFVNTEKYLILLFQMNKYINMVVIYINMFNYIHCNHWAITWIYIYIYTRKMWCDYRKLTAFTTRRGLNVLKLILCS